MDKMFLSIPNLSDANIKRCFANFVIFSRICVRIEPPVKLEKYNSCKISVLLLSNELIPPFFKILPGQIPTKKKTLKRISLESDKCVFLKGKLDAIDTIYEKHFISLKTSLS